MKLVTDFQENYAFIDLSYVLYHNLFRTLKWYDREFGLPTPLNTYDWKSDEEFLKKFKYNVLFTLKTLNSSYNIPYRNFVFAKDCPKSKIWRVSYFPEYKAHRRFKEKKETDVNFGTVFEYCRDIFVPAIVDKFNAKIVSDSTAEADDVLYVLKKYFNEKYPSSKIYLIANDRDLLQLLDNENIIYQSLDGKTFTNKDVNIPEFILKKILLGDGGDNIPSIHPRCGEKATQKYIENKELLKEKLKDEEVLKRFKLNRQLVDLKFIPEEIQKRIMENYDGKPQ